MLDFAQTIAARVPVTASSDGPLMRVERLVLRLSA